MTSKELKTCCQMLAGVGDSRAAATLEVIEELEELIHQLNRTRRVSERFTIDSSDIVEHLKGYIDEFGQMAMQIEWFKYSSSFEGYELKTIPENWNPGYVAVEVLSPEEQAMAATRLVNGLPVTTDPAVTQSEPTNPAGHYDRSDKMGDSAGNKSD